MHSRGTLNSEHRKHDSALVARFAAGDAYPSEVDDAKRLVSGCDECASLAADIKLISTRTSELLEVRRPRDFRISAEQAEQLSGSWFDRVMRRFSAPGLTVVRPLAGAALMIGLALVAVGALPLGSLGSRNAQDATSGVPAVNTQAGGSADFLNGPPAEQPQPQPQASVGGTVVNSDKSGATDTPADSVASAAASTAASTTGTPEGAGSASLVPGVSVETSGAPQTAATAPQPQPSTDASPPKAPGSGSPHATRAPAAYAAPTAAPTKAPPAAPGHATIPLNGETSLDRSGLIVAGLIIAFLALIALGLMWVMRNRYEDPLVR